MANLTVSATIDSFMQAVDQAGARAAIGASSQSLATTATGLSFLALTNPGAITFVRVNADNTVSTLSAAAFRSAIGAGTSDFDGAYGSLSGKPTFSTGLTDTTGTITVTNPYDPAAAATALAAKGDKDLTLNTQTASYTLVLSDDGKYVRMNNAAALNLTVPLNASVAFPTGSQVVIRNTGAGQVTVVAAGGVTINTSQTLKLRAQHSSATLVKVGTNEWDLAGDLEAA